MKVSLKWLRDYVDIVTTPADLAQRLTMGGVEIGGIEDKGDVWDRDLVFVGQITALAPHPNADRLQMVTVDYSSPAAGPRSITVVTGAFNIAVGDKVPLVLAGARVRNEHSGNWEWTILKPGKIRGVESAGMVCSPRELDLGEEHEGILILPADAPVGMPLADYLGDAVLDLDIKGRWDCLSMLGVAREVAAIQQVQLDAPTRPAPAARRLPGRRRDRRPAHRHRDRRPRPVPALLGHGDPRRQDRPVAGLAAGAPAGRRHAPHQQHRGRHQLRHAGVEPAAARLRLRQDPRPARSSCAAPATGPASPPWTASSAS